MRELKTGLRKELELQLGEFVRKYGVQSEDARRDRLIPIPAGELDRLLLSIEKYLHAAQ